MENMDFSTLGVIKRPVISEKSAALTEVGGRYVFEVDTKANKIQIKQAVQQLFNVKVDKVRTSIVHGENRRVGLHHVKKPNWKKAIVTLKEGQKIELLQAKA